MVRPALLHPLVLACLLIATTGCGAVMVGGAAAVGTYAYIKGESVTTFKADVKTGFDASRQALEAMSIPILREKRDAVSGHVIGRLADHQVTITLTQVEPDLVSVGVRVGVWGDENASRRILRAIGQRL